MNKKITEYFKQITSVSHTTLNPKGPGVVRIHLIPPKKPKFGAPWVVILNGQDILPLNATWAILLREFINEANETEGKPLSDEEVTSLINCTIDNVKKIFPKTDREMIKDDLRDIVDTLIKIAKGEEPAIEIGFMTLAKYAKYMRAPHRMDLMISTMSKKGSWNCNQKCLHCYASCQKLAEVNELSTNEWKKIIDCCHDAYIPQLTFTGGEPTIRDDLVELIDYASWFVTRLNTNGVLLSEKLCNELYEASLDSVQITLYATDETIHNTLVGANHYKDTINGIKNALKSNLNVSVNTPLCKLNSDYLTTIKYLANMGVKYFTCSGLIMTGNATNDEAVETYLTKEEMLSIIKSVATYCHQNQLEISFTSPGWIEEDELRKLHLVVPSCGACLSNMAIAPNGMVIPCQSWLSDEPLGNMLTDSWKKIWNNKKCLKQRKQIKNLTSKCPLANKEVI